MPQISSNNLFRWFHWQSFTIRFVFIARRMTNRVSISSISCLIPFFSPKIRTNFDLFGHFCHSLIKAHELLTSARAFAADVRVSNCGVRVCLWLDSVCLPVMGAATRVAWAQNWPENWTDADRKREREWVKNSLLSADKNDLYGIWPGTFTFVFQFVSYIRQRQKAVSIMIRCRPVTDNKLSKKCVTSCQTSERIRRQNKERRDNAKNFRN